MKVLQCIHCGTDVQLPSRSCVMRTYCSSECRVKDKAMKKQLPPTPKCKQCGADFNPIKKSQLYCGAECREESRRDKKYPVIVKACRVCNKEFETRRTTDVVCSPECSEINRVNVVKAKRPVVDNTPRKCEACGEMFEPIRNAQRYCKTECREDYRNRQRAFASMADQTSKREYQRMLYEHGLCRICSPKDLHYAVPGSKACAYHSALCRYNRGVQLGTVEDGWKPKRSDYTLIKFDPNNPLDEYEIEEMMCEPAEGAIGFDEVMKRIRDYYSNRTPDSEYWAPALTPRELDEKGVGARARAALWMGRVPGNIVVSHKTGAISVQGWRTREQTAASWE